MTSHLQLFYFLVFMVCGFFFITFYQDAQALFGEAPRLLRSAQFYLTILIVPVICLLKDFCWMQYERFIFSFSKNKNKNKKFFPIA